MHPILDDLVEIKEMQIPFKSIVWKEWKGNVNKWCLLPYEGYPNGCPSFGSKNCPPNTNCMKPILKKYDTIMLVYLIFNFKKYKDERRIEHPDWSEKQLGNSRHWQKAMHKRMKDFILAKSPDFFLAAGAGFCGKCSIEGGGMNVFKTLQNNGWEIITHTQIKNDVKKYWKLIEKEKTIERNPLNKVVLCSVYATSQETLDFF